MVMIMMDDDHADDGHDEEGHGSNSFELVGLAVGSRYISMYQFSMMAMQIIHLCL